MPVLLSVTPLYLALPVTIIAYWMIWIVYSRFFHPLSKYPGPYLASISRTWIVFQVAGARAEDTQRKLHSKYGSIIRIAPNEVAIAEPTAIKTVYSISSGFTKTDFYPTFRCSFAKHPDLFTDLDEKSHSSRRKIVNNLYSMSNIVHSEEHIDNCTRTLMEKFHEIAQKGDVVDVSKWIHWYAFDVIGELFFSRMFGFMTQAADYRGYIAALECLLPIQVAASVMPSYIRPFFLTGGVIFPRTLKALTSIKNIETAAKDVVAEPFALMKMGECDRKADILNSLFEVMETKGEKVDFGLTEITVEVYTALFAGSDTTTAAVSSILYHLMRTPSAYEKLTLEIDRASISGKLSYPFIKYNEAIKLPYLNTCCKEAMRLHPRVALTLPRSVPAGGCEIAGEFFPAGTRVGINAAVIHRDRSIFGRDADDFVPERWLCADTTIMDRHMFQISLCEMYKLVPQILRTYHLSLVDDTKEWTTHNYWFHKAYGVETKVQVRDLVEVSSKTPQ